MAEPAFTFPLHFIPSAAVLFIENGQVYLHFRENTGTLRGYWAMPGGKSELDDKGVPQTSEQNARAEAGQEAFGVDYFGTDGDGRLSYLFTIPEPSEKGIFLCAVFLAHLKPGEKLVNAEDTKHGPFVRKSVQAWLMEAEKPLPGSKGVLPATRAALEHLLAHPELLKAPAQASGLDLTHAPKHT